MRFRGRRKRLFQNLEVISVIAFDPQLFEPTDAHDLNQTGRIFSIRFHWSLLQACIGVAYNNTQERQSACGQRIPPPHSKRACLEANTREVRCWAHNCMTTLLFI